MCSVLILFKQAYPRKCERKWKQRGTVTASDVMKSIKQFTISMPMTANTRIITSLQFT